MWEKPHTASHNAADKIQSGGGSGVPAILLGRGQAHNIPDLHKQDLQENELRGFYLPVGAEGTDE